jgi:hypothetical protein
LSKSVRSATSSAWYDVAYRDALKVVPNFGLQELSDEQANYFKLVFDEDDKTKGNDSAWQVYAQHPSEARKFLKNLANLWQELFQVPLIKELGQ